MKSKSFLFIILVFALLLTIGSTYSSWVDITNKESNQDIQPITAIWDFYDDDFAKIANISKCSFLTATEETSIVKSGNVAVRLTNTAGTRTKDHSFMVKTDRDYLLNEIKVMKVSFDYYHAEKRQPGGGGFPKVRLAYKGSGKGNTQGGGDTINNNSVFFATNILDNQGNDTGWWHLEYFITALCPTMADHGDTSINANQKINRIKIIDSNIYDYNSNTAFIVVDNVEFSNTLSDRLGMFNRTASVDRSKTEYFWFRVAWSGELNSCTMTFSNPAVAEQDLASTKSPFYIHVLTAGTTTVTATLDIGENHQILTIDFTLTVT